MSMADDEYIEALMKQEAQEEKMERQAKQLASVDTFMLVTELTRRGWVLSTRTRNSKVRPVLYGPPQE